MKLFPIRGGHFAKVDDADYEALSSVKWRMSGYGCAVTGVKSQSMHRHLMSPPAGMDIDHIDGDRLNNQRSNLRICTRSQNIQNSRPRNCKTKTSQFKGVNWIATNARWRSRIKANGQQIPLGCYRTEIEAAQAYDRAALHYFGEFARINLSLGDIAFQ